LLPTAEALSARGRVSAKRPSGPISRSFPTSTPTGKSPSQGPGLLPRYRSIPVPG
jgi:hypothetical protein